MIEVFAGIVVGAAIVLATDYLADRRQQINRIALADAYAKIAMLHTRLIDGPSAAAVDLATQREQSIAATQLAFELGVNPEPPPEGAAPAMVKGVNGSSEYDPRDLEDII